MKYKLEFVPPHVSVIMPVYNGENMLEESIDSILTQTFSNWELIICNDASNDETNKVLDSIMDDRVRIIHNDINLGSGFSRDRAIKMAQGSWLAFTDADDIWLPERLETLLLVVESSENVMVFDDIMECHDATPSIIPWRTLRGRHAFGGDGIKAVDVPLEDFVCLTRLLIKPLLPLRYVRQNYVHHCDYKFGEDTDFFLQLLSYGLTLRYVPKPMYLYRITPGSATSQTNRNTMMREVLENVIDKFGHTPIVQAALRKKIAMVTRDEQYMPFVCAIKQKRLFKLLHIAFQSPWVVIEFLKRIKYSLFYQSHRIYHGGSSRGIK